MQTKIRVTLLLAFAFAFPCKLFAQKLTDSFITAQFNEYKLWMQGTGLNKYLVCDTLVPENGETVMYLTVDGLRNWQTLAGVISNNYAVDLSQVLFDRLAFQMDRAKSKVIVDAQNALVVINFKDNQLYTDIRRTLGPTDNFPRYTVTDLKNLNEYKVYSTNKNIKAFRNEVKNYLRKYFEPYKARYENYRFNDFSDNDSMLLLEISNVVNVVLEDRYFERIELQFFFRTKPGGTDVSYRMTGKYGSGIIWAPHSSRYCPMTPKYQQDVDRFNNKMGNRIFELTQ